MRRAPSPVESPPHISDSSSNPGSTCDVALISHGIAPRYRHRRTAGAASLVLPAGSYHFTEVEPTASALTVIGRQRSSVSIRQMLFVGQREGIEVGGGSELSTPCEFRSIRRVSRSQKFQGRYGSSSSTIVPPSVADSNRARALRRTRRWVSTSPGGPRGRPIGCRVTTVRGYPISRATWANDRTATVTVGRPWDSASLATCPTDTWQTGQTGTRRSASIPAVFHRSTQPGASRRIRPWAHAPTNE